MDAQKQNPILIISGPTATGKTSAGIRLYHELKTRYALSSAVINFDSLLFYRELSIGTAKPSLAEMGEVPHHLVSCASAHHPLTAHDFILMAENKIKELKQTRTIPILVGGSGFYLRALMQGMYPSITPHAEILQRSNELYQQKGILPFWEQLLVVDPQRAQELHPNDHYRIRRAIEHYWMTGGPFSSAHRNFTLQPSGGQWKDSSFFHIHLDLPKEEHWPIITARTETMLSNGLIEEAEELLKQGFSGNERPLQSIGYKEVFLYLAGHIKSKAELSEQISISTRQLAKAQRTWFKKIANKKTYHPLQEFTDLLSDLDNFINAR